MGIIRNVSFMLYGSKHFSKDGYLRASRAFDNSIQNVSLQGKLCIVTGANQGLGLQTSQELAKHGCTLYMVCRNAERGEQAVQQVRSSTGNQDVHLKVCDVSSMASIKAFAEEMNQPGCPVHVLVNNAGVMVQERQQSADGYDINFATNTLGPFALTYLLGNALKMGAPSKVIFVSSGGMLTQPLEVADLQNASMKSYDGTTAYAKDKRRQVAVAERFAELWKSSGVGVYSMHPGWTTTEGVKKSIPGFYKLYQNKFRDLPKGADTIVWLALQDPSNLEPGAFYLDRSPQKKHLTLGGTHYSQQDVDALWSKLCQLAKL